MLLVNAATVARVRKRFVEEGLEDAINDKPRPGRERKLDGKQEAHLVAIACSSPPEGHVNWTLHLLAGNGGEMEFAGSISLETVRQILKKTNSSLEEERVVYPQGERGVRGADGGGAGPRIQYGAGSFITKSTTGSVRWCVLTSPPSSCSGMCGLPLRPLLDGWSAMTPGTSETGPGTCSCSVNRRVGGGTSR